MKTFALCAVLGLSAGLPFAAALEKPGVTYPVFQFPADKIPRIDGDASDWAMVPESYVIGTDQLHDDSKKHPAPDPRTLEVRVRVGWVKGLNRLYFLYEAFDDYWDFAQPGLHNDTFELVVDGDASGGPLIDKSRHDFWTADHVGRAAATPDDRISEAEAHWAIQGVHAQNYHIFTPALNKDWAMVWGPPTWIKELPWANAATSHHFKPGEPGRLTLEFWITPFDYAGPEGPARAVESVLRENKIIGLAWAVIDYDDVNATAFGTSRRRTPCLATHRNCARSASCRWSRRSARRSRRSGRGRCSTWTAASSRSATSPWAKSQNGSGTLAMAPPRRNSTRNTLTPSPAITSSSSTSPVPPATPATRKSGTSSCADFAARPCPPAAR